ncbi:MAG TPA: twin-arginine translocase TatA/TatE family subunit [Nitrosopumilaceae archaeon]|nr:twin-arginine translocase TatA/TatE family subunit [Nitrosopumilaceae archaeon]
MVLESISLQFPGGMEWVWIAIIIGVLLFGAKKIPELAKTFGKAKGEYEKGRIEGDKELEEFKEKRKSDSD